MTRNVPFSQGGFCTILLQDRECVLARGPYTVHCNGALMRRNLLPGRVTLNLSMQWTHELPPLSDSPTEAALIPLEELMKSKSPELGWGRDSRSRENVHSSVKKCSPTTRTSYSDKVAEILDSLPSHLDPLIEDASTRVRVKTQCLRVPSAHGASRPGLQ